MQVIDRKRLKRFTLSGYVRAPGFSAEAVLNILKEGEALRNSSNHILMLIIINIYSNQIEAAEKDPVVWLHLEQDDFGQ